MIEVLLLHQIIKNLLHHQVALCLALHTFKGETEHYGAPLVGFVTTKDHASGQVVL